MNLNGMRIIIKFLLNYFPRSILIRLSIIFRPVFNFLFSGSLDVSENNLHSENSGSCLFGLPVINVDNALLIVYELACLNLFATGVGMALDPR